MALYDVSTSEKKASPELVAGGTLYSANPVGTILPFGGTNIPSGWGLCDGSAVSKTTYAELYSVIGDSFKGNKTPASGNFCLPDLRECTLKGASDTNNDTYTIGTHQKIAVGEFLDDRIQEHTHSAKAATTPANNGSSTPVLVGSANVSTGTNTGRTGSTTEVKSVGVNYIICMKQTSIPADFLSAVDEAVEEALADTGWVTVGSYVKARRIGKMVSLAITYNTSVINPSNWTKVADLDAEFRPSKQVLGCSYCIGGTTYDNYFISPTGTVNLLGNASLDATVDYFVD